MTFKVGDRIRCIDISRTGLIQKPLVAGQVYTVVDLSSITGNMLVSGNLYWWAPERFELVEEERSIMKPHKWHDVIIAWARGAKVEHRFQVSGGWSKWYEDSHPVFDQVATHEYRVFKEPKPDVFFYGKAVANGVQSYCSTKGRYDNVKFTFDGETGKLKAVELLDNN